MDLSFGCGKVELEKLNSSTDVINKLELDLEEARIQFRTLLNESTRKLNRLTKELGPNRQVVYVHIPYTELQVEN